MQFSGDFANAVESVDVLQTNRQTGIGDVVVSGVRMLIIPLETTPQELDQVGRSTYKPRYGASLETPNSELVRNRIIRRADGSHLNIVRVLAALGEMELELEETRL